MSIDLSIYKAIIKVYEKNYHKTVDEFMWNEYSRIKDKDENEDLTQIEKEFRSKFWSWDKGDCSKVGMLKILLWYIASLENADPWMQNEYKELIESLNK